MRTGSSLSSLPLGAPSGTAGGSSTAPPLTWAEADRQWLRAQGATHVEGLVLAGSSQNSTGFEGVYASAGGFGAKLQKGAKRLRQDGFRSPVEAALARARWTKSLDEGKGRPSATAAGASSGQQEQLAAEALADLATVEGKSMAQPVVSAKDTEAAHKDRRWLARPLYNLADFLEGVWTGEGGSGAELQKAKHLRQTGASSPPPAPLERAGHTEEDRGTTVSITSSSATSAFTTEPHQQAAASDGSSTCSTVAEKVAMHVICNYTPRAPGELPRKQWVSCAQLLRQLHPHTVSEDHVKQLVTNHFKDHPAFAGHDFHAWTKMLKDYDAPAGAGRKSVTKFSLEYTPASTGALEQV